jgi:hypothetical protein
MVVIREAKAHGIKSVRSDCFAPVIGAVDAGAVAGIDARAVAGAAGAVTAWLNFPARIVKSVKSTFVS